MLFRTPYLALFRPHPRLQEGRTVPTEEAHGLKLKIEVHLREGLRNLPVEHSPWPPAPHPQNPQVVQDVLSSFSFPAILANL